MSVALGSFDTSFYGISLAYPSEADLKRVGSYASAESVAEWSAAPGRAAIETAGLVSAPDHELRHFHDFLLSPFGASLMALRVEATINGVQALNLIMEAPQGRLPTPLCRWIEWDGAQRAAWLAANGEAAGISSTADFVPVPEPSERRLKDGSAGLKLDSLTDEEALAITAEAGFMAFSAMSGLREARDLDVGLGAVSADSIFEASAHLVQAQAIWTGQSASAAAEYMKLVEGDSVSALGPYNRLREALQKGRSQLQIRRLSELFTWMLLGHPDELKDMGHPANRYFLVLAFAMREPEALLGDRSTETLWAGLDELAKSDWRRNLAMSLAAFDRRERKYAILREQLDGELIHAVLDTADLWVADSRKVIEAVLASPGDYATPLSYLTTMAAELPFPFIRHHFQTAVHRRTEPVAAEGVAAIVSESDPLNVYAYVTTLSQKGVRERDSVLLAMRANSYVDYCFYSDPPETLIDQFLQAESKAGLGKQFIQIY